MMRMKKEQTKKTDKLTSFQVTLLGFAGVILLGAALLCLPVSSKSGRWTPFINSLFTSTSAVCVTGLVAYDTATQWSYFGQAVILLLIQIGGLGVILTAASFAMVTGRKVGLFGRDSIRETISAPTLGGIMDVTGFVLKAFFLLEAVGAVCLAPVFIRDFGAKGIWMAVFTAVSAFCNAGFDLMGVRGPFSSLTSYAAQPVVNAVVMLLIVIGGIGFLVWEDVVRHGLRFRRYRLQSKAAIVTSAVLIVLPAVMFFFLEFSGLPLGERLAASLFQSITTRTAGFNTADLAAMDGSGKALTIFLMLIGGSPGSTAGGMKTTTVAVLFSAVFSVCMKRENAQIMNRRIDDETTKNAAVILVMYLTLFFFAGIAISEIEGLPLGDCLFETASAVGTVGLTLGITPTLGAVSKLILMCLMFYGRVGVLTLIYAAMGKKRRTLSKPPMGRLSVG